MAVVEQEHLDQLANDILAIDRQLATLSRRVDGLSVRITQAGAAMRQNLAPVRDQVEGIAAAVAGFGSAVSEAVAEADGRLLSLSTQLSDVLDIVEDPPAVTATIEEIEAATHQADAMLDRMQSAFDTVTGMAVDAEDMFMDGISAAEAALDELEQLVRDTISSAIAALVDRFADAVRGPLLEATDEIADRIEAALQEQIEALIEGLSSDITEDISTAMTTLIADIREAADDLIDRIVAGLEGDTAREQSARGALEAGLEPLQSAFDALEPAIAHFMSMMRTVGMG